MLINFQHLVALIFISTSAIANFSINNYFNTSICDQVLLNGGYFKTCYDYRMKGAKYVAYSLSGSLVYKNNIRTRPRFTEDTNVPRKYRSHYSDYTRNYYKNDRGHLASDASFDYSQRSLKSVYVMSNIIPQHHSINGAEEAWMGLEKLGRRLAKQYGVINVLNGVEYGKNPKRIGHNGIAVPEAFWKI